MKKYFKKTFALSDKGAKDMLLAMLWSIIVNFAILLLSLLLYFFLEDSVLTALGGNIPTFNVLRYVILAVVLFAMVVVSYYFQFRTAYLSAYNESANQRITLAETLRKLPLSFFGKKDLTDVTNTIMNDTYMIQEGFSHFIPEFFGSIIAITMVSIGMLIFNYKMAISVIWVVPISFIFCLATRKLQSRHAKATKDIQLSYLGKTQECIENIKDIKANNRQSVHLQEMDVRLTKHEETALKGELVTGFSVTLSQMILKVGIATAMLMGIHLLIKGEIDIVIFLVFMMIATRIFEPLNGTLINLAAIFVTLLSVDRMREIYNTPIQTGAENIDNSGFDIVFKDVNFAYNDGETVLNGVSFTAKQGEVTALVGPSGGGKSTAVKLAARFWDVNSGEITLGGVDIKEIDPETLLKDFSIVFQDVTLFNNTVMENIRIGKKGASDEEVIECAKYARCHDFIAALPNGYDTLIGENGSRLSGGERQRISIARALLKDAPIVLLDEATSSLDIKNETAIQEAISNLTRNKTVIVIAHRMRTIMGADKIIMLKNGKVAQEGTHEKLMSVEGEYQTMVNLQTQGANWKLTH